MNEIIEQLLDRVTGLELALCEMQMKEEKQRKNESSPCTPSKKENRKKEENAMFFAHARGRKPFSIPTVEEVDNYIKQIGTTRFTAQEFVDYYNAVGWMLGHDRPMKDWRASVKNWCSYQKRQLVSPLKYASAPHPVATPQFHETEAYLQNMERERKQAVSYEEYKRRLAEGRLR